MSGGRRPASSSKRRAGRREAGRPAGAFPCSPCNFLVAAMARPEGPVAALGRGPWAGGAARAKMAAAAARRSRRSSAHAHCDRSQCTTHATFVYGDASTFRPSPPIETPPKRRNADERLCVRCFFFIFNVTLRNVRRRPLYDAATRYFKYYVRLAPTTHLATFF